MATIWMNAIGFRQQMCTNIDLVLPKKTVMMRVKYCLPKQTQCCPRFSDWPPVNAATLARLRKWQINQNISVNYRTIGGMVVQNSHRMPPLLLMLPLSPARKDVKIDAYQLLNERNL
nr:hypothetical protein [Serratia proteamaculans]